MEIGEVGICVCTVARVVLPLNEADRAWGDRWQFITLAGLHTNALISNRFAKAFAKDGMKAYALGIQEVEIEEGCEVVKHQNVSRTSTDEIACMW